MASCWSTLKDLGKHRDNSRMLDCLLCSCVSTSRCDATSMQNYSLYNWRLVQNHLYIWPFSLRGTSARPLLLAALWACTRQWRTPSISLPILKNHHLLSSSTCPQTFPSIAAAYKRKVRFSLFQSQLRKPILAAIKRNKTPQNPTPPSHLFPGAANCSGTQPPLSQEGAAVKWQLATEESSRFCSLCYVIIARPLRNNQQRIKQCWRSRHMLHMEIRVTKSALSGTQKPSSTLSHQLIGDISLVSQ